MSRFWWFLRDCWHMPSFHGEHSWSFTFYYGGHWSVRHALRVYRISKRALWLDIKTVVRMLWWRLLWLQPFRCNGNRGGWRTRVCDWLENKARSCE